MLGNRPKLTKTGVLEVGYLLAGDMKLLEKAVTIYQLGISGGKLVISLKIKIRSFSIKYTQRLTLDKTTVKKHLEEKLIWAVVEGKNNVNIKLIKQNV